MSISAKAVSELRKSTGAGMMDCKEALKESGGDIDGALDWLRKKGQKVAAKRADRDANEGVVIAMADDAGKTGVVMAVSCETDFVAKNDGFIEFVNSLAMHIAAMAPTIMTPEGLDLEFVQKETEALQAQIKAENELNESENLGKPMKVIPQFGSRLQMTDEVLAAAEAQIKEELKAEGKPEKIWDRIVPGKLERFISDNSQLDQQFCLLSQVYALDDSMTVAQAVENVKDVELVDFKRVSVG
ncbi:UNVERIFIED_CONTAM: hypothetical protein GTU68_045983 [Idotea baltica]|nr:hypothetical protein [Idotea baltica]